MFHRGHVGPAVSERDRCWPWPLLPSGGPGPGPHGVSTRPRGSSIHLARPEILGRCPELLAQFPGASARLLRFRRGKTGGLEQWWPGESLQRKLQTVAVLAFGEHEGRRSVS